MMGTFSGHSGLTGSTGLRSPVLSPVRNLTEKEAREAQLTFCLNICRNYDGMWYSAHQSLIILHRLGLLEKYRKELCIQFPEFEVFFALRDQDLQILKNSVHRKNQLLYYLKTGWTIECMTSPISEIRDYSREYFRSWHLFQGEKPEEETLLSILRTYSVQQLLDDPRAICRREAAHLGYYQYQETDKVILLNKLRQTSKMDEETLQMLLNSKTVLMSQLSNTTEEYSDDGLGSVQHLDEAIELLAPSPVSSTAQAQLAFFHENGFDGAKNSCHKSVAYRAAIELGFTKEDRGNPNLSLHSSRIHGYDPSSFATMNYIFQGVDVGDDLKKEGSLVLYDRFFQENNYFDNYGLFATIANTILDGRDIEPIIKKVGTDRLIQTRIADLWSKPLELLMTESDDIAVVRIKYGF